LLAGVVRAEGGHNPAQDLRSHFGISDQALSAALNTGSVSIDPTVGAPITLSELPELSDNARRCLGAAAEIQAGSGASDLGLHRLFGGLLENPDGAAWRVLQGVVPDISIERLSENHRAWLHDSGGLTYAENLERAFPRATAQSPASPGDPWMLLGVLQMRTQTADGDEVRSAGLGFLLPGRQSLITVAGVADRSPTLTLRYGEGDHQLTPAPRREGNLAVLDLTTSLASGQDGLMTAAAVAGQACTISAVNDHSPAVVRLAGTVRTAEDPGERFTVDLTSPLAETHVAMGSPVISAGGQIIGIVGPTASNLSVDAYGVQAITRAAVEIAAPRRIATGTLSGAGNDAVGDVDQLGFKTYVRAFADLITSPYTKPPLTIGIFGSWGMGKSFLLEHIEREINARQAGDPDVVPRVHVVRFNAWEYSATEVVWPGLVRKIVTRLDQLYTWPWYRRLRTRVWWNLKRQWRQLSSQIIAVALVAAAGFVIALAQDAANVAKAIAGVTVLLSVGGLIKAAKDPVAQWVTALFADSDYGRQLGVMEDIKHDLETLEQRLHGTDADGNDVVTGRILVLIDDLDRCEPGKAVEVLQAVNLLLNFSSFIVCLGIDARIITGAVERHYEGLLGKAGASGYEYLDKIVQIPFRIPEAGPPEIVEFVTGQLGNPQPPAPEPQPAAPPPAPADAEPTTAVSANGATAPTDGTGTDGAGAPGLEPAVALSPEAEVPFTYEELEAFTMFAEHLRPNPRHLKRIVNVYRLVRALARVQDEQLILEQPAATIRWLVMWSQWPYASLAMLERYDVMVDQWGAEIPASAPPGEPMLHLLDHVETGLDAVIRARLDDDPADLRALLTIEDCGLTWEQIGHIRRYTVNFNPAVEEQLRTPATSSAR
jgi:hypothetical protein